MTSSEDGSPPDAATIRADLRAGRPVRDDDFDRAFPQTHRYRSGVHWTPVAVALRAAALLADAPGGWVLDVGAGVGKACLVGAMTSSLRWDGIERSERMVRAARMAARAFGIEDQARFLLGDALALDWSPYGGIYLYNPFAEAMWGERIRAPEDTGPTWREEITGAQQKLAALAPGTQVVTFHGFGGDVPPGFVELAREALRAGEVCLWQRRT